ncbi:MAG: DUF2325 domain-containing protein [Bacillales bacterium]
MSNSVLVVGGDRLGEIPEKLATAGFSEVLHISGRRESMVKRDIPKNIDMILVLTDFVNHNISTVIKKKAKKQSIPIFFAKRSWNHINEILLKDKNRYMKTSV